MGKQTKIFLIRVVGFSGFRGKNLKGEIQGVLIPVGAMIPNQIRVLDAGELFCMTGSAFF